MPDDNDDNDNNNSDLNIGRRLYPRTTYYIDVFAECPPPDFYMPFDDGYTCYYWNDVLNGHIYKFILGSSTRNPAWVSGSSANSNDCVIIEIMGCDPAQFNYKRSTSLTIQCKPFTHHGISYPTE